MNRTSHRIAIGFVLAPLALALAVPVHRIGAGARQETTSALAAHAEAAAGAVRAALAGGGAPGLAAATRAVLDALPDTLAAAFYDADGGAVVTGAALPATLDEVVVERLRTMDRTITTRLGARTAAVAPVQDADGWDIIGVAVLVRTAADPARLPAGPLAHALAAWLLAGAALLAGLRWRRKVALAGVAIVAGAGFFLLGRWPAAGGHGLAAVLAFSGWAVVAAIGLSLAALRRPLALREAKRAWAFLAPSLAHLLVFSVGPIVFSLWLSFHEWDLLAPARPFVGLDNYQELARDGDFLRALRNTAVYVLFVPVGMVLALGLALFVDRRMPGVNLLRTVFFLPYITSFVAISLVWRWMFQPDVGLLNHLLTRVGIPAQPWLSSPATALPSLMLMSVWMYAGYMMVLFLAGLQSIPASLYESARIDGAGAWQRFRHITLPLLRPTALFVLVTMVIFMFQVFTAVYVMTEGGPLHATDVIVYHIYRNAWEYLRMGYASAMAWVLFAIVFLVTLVQFRWLGRTSP